MSERKAIENGSIRRKIRISGGVGMLKTTAISLAAVFVIVGVVCHTSFASAAPFNGAAAMMNGLSSNVENVQWRVGRYRPPFYGYGFAAGAFFGGMFAPPYVIPGPYYYSDPEIDGPFSPVADCMRRFKSYDPGSKTYLGRDRQRHPCPVSE